MDERLEKRTKDDMTEVDLQKWVYDSSVDHVGKIPLRASTGVWNASLFIMAIEFSERLSYYGIATNLITYLTKVIHQDLKTAAKGVNYWQGVTALMPLVGGYLADAYVRKFSMVMIASTIYLMGLSLLVMSQLIPSMKGPKAHEVVFFLAIYLISLGTGGHKPSLQSFGGDQFDDGHLEERKKKMSFFNWWSCALCSGVVVAVTVIVYIQDNVSWVASYTILVVIMALTMVVFYVGKPFYRYRTPQGSPFTPMLQVLVAAIRNRNLAYPSDLSQLHEIRRSENNERRLLSRTRKLRFLDKAAIIEAEESGGGSTKNPWRLASVTQVEELKLVLNMVPIWVTCFVFGLCLAQTTTLFIKQGSTMDRNIGGHFEIPPATVFCIAGIGMIVSISIYDKILVPVIRKVTGNERGMSILQRIGIGMVLSMVSMINAALVERKRLRVAAGASNGGFVAMSVFWLAPQFFLNGIGNGFTLVGMQEFFYDQAPDSMRSLGIALYCSVLGIGDILSGFLITFVDEITRGDDGVSWFGKDLNHSRIDKFYWLLAGISWVDMCFYVLLAKSYSYKNVNRDEEVSDVHGDPV